MHRVVLSTSSWILMLHVKCGAWASCNPTIDLILRTFVTSVKFSSELFRHLLKHLVNWISTGCRHGLSWASVENVIIALRLMYWLLVLWRVHKTQSCNCEKCRLRRSKINVLLMSLERLLLKIFNERTDYYRIFVHYVALETCNNGALLHTIHRITAYLTW